MVKVGAIWVPRVPWVPEVVVHMGNKATIGSIGTGGVGLYRYHGYHRFHAYRRRYFTVPWVQWLLMMVVYMGWLYLLGLMLEHCFLTLLNLHYTDFSVCHLICIMRNLGTMGIRGTAGGG